MMLIWIIYDISKNKSRRKVANLCKLIGLYRVQRSAFFGSTKKMLLKDFRKQTKKLINQQHDSVLIGKMRQKEYYEIIQVGQGFNKRNVGGRRNLIII